MRTLCLISLAGTSRAVLLGSSSASPTRGSSAGAGKPDALFQDAVSRCESLLAGCEGADSAFAEVPRMLRAVFDADFELYCRLTRPTASTLNMTCLCPDDPGAAIRGDGLINAALRPGRVCVDGACGGSCSRLVLPEFATAAECDALRCLAAEHMALAAGDAGAAHMQQFNFVDSVTGGHVRTTLLMVRLVERLRRATAHEYGLPLPSVAPHSAFVSRWAPGAGCGDGTPVHGDEAACAGFHYSSVLHLASQGGEFDGGDFVFSDPPHSAALDTAPSRTAVEIGLAEAAPPASTRRKSSAGRLLTRVAPVQGRAMIFSSGWENLHFVDVIRTGARFAMPAFFVTRPFWNQDGPSDVRGPVGLSETAAALLRHILLTPDEPEEEGELTEKYTVLWHLLFAAPIEGE